MTSASPSSAAVVHDARPPFLLSVGLVAGRVSLHGELDRQHVARLLEAVTALAGSPASRWSLDMAGVTFCDAAGLRALLTARGLAERAGRPFAVIRCSPWLRRLLHLAGLSELLDPADRDPQAPAAGVRQGEGP